MVTTCVYTIRLPQEVRKAMDEMPDVNWQSDIRQAVGDMVRARKRQKLIADSDKVRERTKDIGISASELIREDRDAR